jgi:hypothetical protein
MVMSIILCHEREGGTRALLLVVVNEDCKHHSLHTGSVIKGSHRVGPPAHLPEKALYGVGRPDQLAALLVGHVQEGQQLVLVGLEA